MIGDMIAKVRTEKGMTKTELARLTGINIGHLTHIEKGERNHSHKALKNICSALNIPYQQLMFTYDKQINEEQESYGSIKHLSYNKVLAVEKLNSFVDCPSNISSASLAVKMADSSMEPAIKKGEFAFIELNSLLNSKDIGLFSVNKKVVIRKFYDRNGKITLKALDKSIEDIKISDSDEFFIIGKVL